MHRNLPQLLMRLEQELIEQIQFVHQFQSGRVDGIAAKIAKKILVLFEHKHLHSSTREQKTKHDPSRPTADDAAFGVV
jgi:hypothetical protein